MINKSYFINVPPRNIINDYTPKTLSSNIENIYTDSSLENMIINSNLANESIIK